MWNLSRTIFDDQGLLLPRPKLGVGFATPAKQEQHRPTSSLPPSQVNLKVFFHSLPINSSSPLSQMTDSYQSSRNGDVISNGGPNGSSPSLIPPTQPAGLSNVIRKKLMGYVGFANLPNQVHRKSVRKGFQFTAMVVGQSLLHPLFVATCLTPNRGVWPWQVHTD